MKQMRCAMLMQHLNASVISRRVLPVGLQYAGICNGAASHSNAVSSRLRSVVGSRVRMIRQGSTLYPGDEMGKCILYRTLYLSHPVFAVRSSL